jgi:folate-binding protein YgfZ
MDSAESLHTEFFLDPEARDRVVVSGADALIYLHSQISQDVRDLPIGAERWTLVLEPGGKVDTLARVTRTGEDTWVLDTDAGFGEGLAKRLQRFKIRVDADVTMEPAVRATPRGDFEDRRIDAGWPRMGREITPGDTIPAVTGVVAMTVNFTKGCYPGQELVERMDSRGAAAPSSLRIVVIGHDVPAGVGLGDSVMGPDGTVVGTITSVGTRHALAQVKRGHSVGTVPEHAR